MPLRRFVNPPLVIVALAPFGIQSQDQIWSGDETGVQNVPAASKVLGHHNTTAHRLTGNRGKQALFSPL